MYTLKNVEERFVFKDDDFGWIYIETKLYKKNCSNVHIWVGIEKQSTIQTYLKRNKLKFSEL